MGKAFFSSKLARGIWYFLGGLCFVEAMGLFAIAPYWDAGTIVGEIHALACFIGGAGVTFFLLATSEPGRAIGTKLNRYVFAACGGLAADVIVTWALRAVGYPIVNGTVRRGLMASNYWLGPVILAYTAIVWFVYRRALAKELRTM